MKLSFKKAFRILVLILLCGVTFLSMTVFADEIYDTYSYGADTTALAAPDAVSLERIIDSSSPEITLGSITDLFYSSVSQTLYAVDQTNNRVVRFAKNGEVLGTISGFLNNGVWDSFHSPTGVFADSQGHLYIADTENARIVELDSKGELVRIIGTPESTVLGENFDYKPIHLVRDSIDRFYIISTGFNQGVLCLDETGAFLNCTGTPAVAFDPVQYFWKIISTKQQKERMDKFVPTEYNNISIDSEDFLYVSCNTYTIWDYLKDSVASLRKLNAKGSDILKKDENGFSPYGDRKIVKNADISGGSSLVDVISMDYGMFCTVDSNRKRVFVYNEQSQLLFEFGAPGDYSGTFRNPTAVEYIDGNFFVADGEKGTIAVFRLNSYGEMLMEAARLHNIGDYIAEEELWSEIFSLNNNSSIALTGLANVEYRNSDYKASMLHFKLADDIEGYSKSFKEYRNGILNRYSVLIIAVAVSVIFCIVLIFKLYKRHLASDHYNPGKYEASLEFGRRTIFRPMSHFWDLTWEKRGTMAAAVTILIASELIMLFDTYGTGYIFAGKSMLTTNPLTVIFKLPGILLLYCACNWCVTSLMDGKAKFSQIFMANCYALLPIVFLIPLAVLISNFITYSEGTFYHLIVGLCYLWVLVLIICANKQIHDYYFGKSIGVLLLTVVVMVIAVFLMVLFLALIQQMFDFFVTIMNDIGSRLI